MKGFLFHRALSEILKPNRGIALGTLGLVVFTLIGSVTDVSGRLYAAEIGSFIGGYWEYRSKIK